MNFSIRPMEAKDLDITLAWRNDPEVLETALTSNEISAKEHESMFLYNNSVKLIFEVDNEPAGYVQVSRDPDENKGEWSFHMGSKHRGQGLSVIMLYGALYYLAKKEGYKKIESKIKDTNRASYHLHYKLGFRHVDTSKNILNFEKKL